MNWPEPRDYSEAIQNPKLCFVDPDLKTSQVRTDARGLPRVTAGQFASVYEIFRPTQAWAVRCFQRNVSGQRQRYESVHQHLKPLGLAPLVSFEYLQNGILLTRGAGAGCRRYPYPVVKMEWVRGQTLDNYVRNNLLNGAALLKAAEGFREALVDLKTNGIAHGDLQHANVLVQKDGALRFVDYDAMFVPALKGQSCPETGLRNFQHPGRTGYDYDDNIDAFSALVIYTSLRALAYDPLLWRFNTGENLIFSESDFTVPRRSLVFQQLGSTSDKGVALLAAELEKACAIPVSKVTPFEHIVKLVPAPSLIPSRRVTAELTNLQRVPAVRLPTLLPVGQRQSSVLSPTTHTSPPPIIPSGPTSPSRHSGRPSSSPAPRPRFTLGALVGLGCLSLLAVWLVFVVISLLIQQRAQTSSMTSPDSSAATNPNGAQPQTEETIRTPNPGESIEFDVTVQPNHWSPLITIPRDYHLSTQIVGSNGVKIWRAVDGSTERQTMITNTPGKVWDIWSNTLLGIYNPLAKHRPYMDGPWANSVRYQSAESFSVRLRIRLEPARQNIIANSNIHTFNLQQVAYRDAYQLMRQEWPRERFGYFDTKIFYGDISGDGSDEAAVLVHYRLSGEASTPSFSHVFVYATKGSEVVLIATLKGGDRAYGGIESVKIADGRLLLGRYKPETPNACMACYGFVETTDYRWDGSRFVVTRVNVSKLERKSQNTSVESDDGLLAKGASRGKLSPTIPPGPTSTAAAPTTVIPTPSPSTPPPTDVYYFAKIRNRTRWAIPYGVWDVQRGWVHFRIVPGGTMNHVRKNVEVRVRFDELPDHGAEHVVDRVATGIRSIGFEPSPNVRDQAIANYFEVMTDGRVGLRPHR
jgi:serine/threonine protein kinase